MSLSCSNSTEVAVFPFSRYVRTLQPRSIFEVRAILAAFSSGTISSGEFVRQSTDNLIVYILMSDSYTFQQESNPPRVSQTTAHRLDS